MPWDLIAKVITGVGSVIAFAVAWRKLGKWRERALEAEKRAEVRDAADKLQDRAREAREVPRTSDVAALRSRWNRRRERRRARVRQP